MEAIVKERDFYFQKLQQIEQLVQDHENRKETCPAAQILEILYATEVLFVLFD